MKQKLLMSFTVLLLVGNYYNNLQSAAVSDDEINAVSDDEINYDNWIEEIAAPLTLTTEQENLRLFEGIKARRLDQVELALLRGANPDAVLPNNFSALSFAIINHDPKIVSALLHEGADVNKAQPYTPLMIALNLFQQKSDIETIKNIIDQLLSAGALRRIASSRDDKGRAAIHFVGFIPDSLGIYGRELRKKIIASVGPEGVNIKDKDLNTPLIYAAVVGSTTAVQELFSAGAQKTLNAQNVKGNTALMHALTNSHIDTAERLLDLGAGVSQKNKDDDTAFSIALTLSKRLTGYERTALIRMLAKIRQSLIRIWPPQ